MTFDFSVDVRINDDLKTEVKMVTTQAGENITRRFIAFCAERELPLADEDAIRHAMVQYRHQRF